MTLLLYDIPFTRITRVRRIIYFHDTEAEYTGIRVTNGSFLPAKSDHKPVTFVERDQEEADVT